MKKFNKHSYELIRGSLNGFVVKILVTIVGFILNIIIAQRLGAINTGYYFLALSIVLVLVNLCQQGFNIASVRFIAEALAVNNSENISNFHTYAIYRVLPVALAAAIIMHFSASVIAIEIFKKPELASILKIIALSLVPLTLSQFYSYCMQGEKKIIRSLLAQSGGVTFLFTFLIIITNSNDLKSVCINYVISSILVFIITTYYFNKRHSLMRNYEKNSYIKKVKLTLPSMYLIVVMAMIIDSACLLMLGIYSDAASVALYSVASRIAILTSFVLIAVNSIAAPKFSEAYHLNDREALKIITMTSARLMVSVAIPIIVVILLFAENLMGLFGEEFIKGATALRILAVGQFINVLTGSVGVILQMTGKEKYLRNNLILSTAIILIGGFIIIPIYGLIGGSILTSASLVIQNLLCVYHVHKETGINTLKLF